MNILHIIAGIDPKSGGTTTALRNILQAESCVGIRHEVLTIEGRTHDPAITNSVPVFIARPSAMARYARSIDAIEWLGKNAGRFDLVLIHGIWAWLPWKASNLLFKLRKPFIFLPHGQLDPFDVQKKWLAKKILGPLCISRMLNRASAVLCTAKREAEVMIRYGAKPRIEALPLPVPSVGPDTARPDSPRKVRRSVGFRSRWGIAEDAFVFLFLSRINYKKGLDILIPAFAEISADHPNTILIVAGSDNEGYGVLVKKWIAECRIEPKVIFPGFLEGDAKMGVFGAANCFVLPSRNENFALAAVEALIAGVPVIISENVYIADEICSASAGWVCTNSIDSLIKVMKNAIDNHSDYSEKKQATIAAARLYGVEQTGLQYIQFYKDLISNN